MRPDIGFGNRRETFSVEGRPGFLVNLSLEGRLERLVGIVRIQEVAMAHEETLFVVVGGIVCVGDVLPRLRKQVVDR